MKPRCAITNLPICCQDKVVMFFLEPNDPLEIEEGDQPFVFSSLPIFGVYDDFYYLSAVKRDINVEILENFYKKPIGEIAEDIKIPKIWVLQSAYESMIMRHVEICPNFTKSIRWTKHFLWNGRKWHDSASYWSKTKKEFVIDYVEYDEYAQEIKQLNHSIVKRYIERMFDGCEEISSFVANVARFFEMMGRCNLTIQPFQPIAIHGRENLANQKWLLDLCSTHCKKLMVELYGCDE